MTDAPQGNNTDCTSPKTPEKVSIDGVLLSLDLTKHTLVLEDKEGIPHPGRWNPGSAIDEYMQKQRQGFGETITGTVTDGVMDIIGAKFFDKKTMPQKPKSQWKGGQPRNEKAIILQCCMKVAGEVFIGCLGGNSNGQSYEATMDRVTAAAVKAAGELCKQAGVV